jgi:hypothetical protein
MDADNHLIADCCEDLLGTLVALRHGWSYSAGTRSQACRAPLPPCGNLRSGLRHLCMAATRCFALSPPYLQYGRYLVAFISVSCACLPSILCTVLSGFARADKLEGRISFAILALLPLIEQLRCRWLKVIGAALVWWCLGTSPTKPARRTCRSRRSTSTRTSQVPPSALLLWCHPCSDLEIAV